LDPNSRTTKKISGKNFRGKFTAEKPEGTIRIFSVGGSTTKGHAVEFHETYPFFLQENFNNADLDLKVEVINAGKESKWSLQETQFIKNELVKYEPDLFLIYDGWNEVGHETWKYHPKATPDLWFERWKEICSLGKTNGFSTIVTIQPTVATGNKILTIEEKQTRDDYLQEHPVGKQFLESYPLYLEKLSELKNHCPLTADLTGLYDNIEGPIYYDFGHTGPRGNKIIADKFFELSVPFVLEKSQRIDDIKVNQNLLSKNTTDEHLTRATSEINYNLDSNDSDNFIEESYDFLGDIISQYKTPKIFPLIFET